MKDDAPAPDRPPHKRRVLQNIQHTPDTWLAIWANYDLTPSELRRVQEERERRKALRGRDTLVVATIRGPEGFTPQQRSALMDAIPENTSEVCPLVTDPRSETRMRRLIQRADLVLAAPREMTSPTNVPAWERSPVWAAIAYAKHRRTAVKVIMPDGREE